MESKPGIKTTEFWLALLVPFISGIAVGVANQFGIPVPTETIYAAVGAAITYIANRAWVKGAETKAAAVAATVQPNN